MTCPGEDALIEHFALGAADGATGELALHIDGCPACRALVAEMARWTRTPPALTAEDVIGDVGEVAAPPLASDDGAPLEVKDGLVPPQLGGYRIRRLLGRGAMGRVYEAYDPVLRRAVAVKVMAAAEPDEETRRRFLVEARAFARLQDPNVVAIHHVGETEGRPYLVAELVRGQSLDRLDLPVGWRRAMAVAVGAARGLAAAHQRGVLHRDIKPANIMLTDEGQVKLLDFGLAKLTRAGTLAAITTSSSSMESDTQPVPGWPGPGGVAEWAAATRSGILLGTPNYLAPEVWHGEKATRASDVYSLGVVLHELCTGHPPFQGSSLAQLRVAVTTGPLVPLLQAVPEIDPGFAAIVDRCLGRSAGERFASGQALLAALNEVAGGERARGTGSPRKPAHARRRWRRWAAIDGVAAAVLAILAAVMGGGGRTVPVVPAQQITAPTARMVAPGAASPAGPTPIAPTPPAYRAGPRPIPPDRSLPLPPDRPGRLRRHATPRPRPPSTVPPAARGDRDGSIRTDPGQGNR